MDHRQAVTELIESGLPLGTIETPSVERVVRLFRRHELATGQALYAWRPGAGLCRLGMENIRIPRTLTLGEALDFIGGSIHFGIYLILGAGDALRRERVIERLRRFARSPARVRRLVVLVDGSIPQVPELQPLTLQLRHGVRRARQKAG
jgi:hypothetical protein